MLALLTNGRYQFVYDDDFKICDNLSGGIARSVTTLSGGETFLASLSLAMAVTEFTAMFRGREIEFMFLDEGFGTLDEYSLDTAIQTLLTLGDTGRMVGIISHVQQLRAYIPTRLEVRYSPTGSSVKWAL